MNIIEAEHEIVRELVQRFDERDIEASSEGSSQVGHIMGLPRTIEEIRRRIDRTSKLSGSSLLRIGQGFLKETDSKLR